MPFSTTSTGILGSNIQLTTPGVYQDILSSTFIVSKVEEVYLVTVVARTVINVAPGGADSWVTLKFVASDETPRHEILGSEFLLIFISSTQKQGVNYQESSEFTFIMESSAITTVNLTLQAAAFGGPFNYVDIHSDSNGRSSLGVIGLPNL